MGKEIERKFLVDPAKAKKFITKAKWKLIKQGYLNLDPTKTVRVRTIMHGNITKAYITVKGKNVGLVRDEFEYQIPADDAEQMMAMCGDNIITKIRHEIHYKRNMYELDVFMNNLAGLVVCELELDDPDDEFEAPDMITHEVSDDPRFYNSNLIGLLPEDVEDLIEEINNKTCTD